ncbi:hypothetical protein Mp_2g24500 [Marchantia polymorpha subsp. ruderalis]|uniref:Uncharacterized protein n=1 Tax=Marchantia polymorpha TaxID=3197 RepID=A0A2R6VZG5_MARPO|nr:hypothetical protein MARPO_0246s0003 [Marchantia polymorpha]BBN03564.1 hypothetical protein Mp_2g24500 [Marchantia polymorpha subsp. ruderalis]|eukprot:PTQ26994.1 hypothetical protein MARPO_0246s0003 [Marchantia polymorpha]
MHPSRSLEAAALGASMGPAGTAYRTSWRHTLPFGLQRPIGFLAPPPHARPLTRRPAPPRPGRLPSPPCLGARSGGSRPPPRANGLPFPLSLFGLCSAAAPALFLKAPALGRGRILI